MNRSLDRKMPLLEKAMLVGMYGLGFFGYYYALFIAVILYIPSRTVTVPHRGIMLGLTLVALFYMLFRGRQIYKGRLIVLFILFWCAMCLRIIFEAMTGALLPHPISYYLIYGVGVCAIPVIAFLVRQNIQSMSYGFWAMVVFGQSCAGLAFGLYGAASGFGRVKGGDFIGDFVAIGPLHLAYLGSALLVFGLYTLLHPQHFQRLCNLDGIWAKLFIVFGLGGLLILLFPRPFRARLLQFSITLILMAGGAYLMVLGSSRGPVVAAGSCGIFLALSKVKKPEDFFKFIIILIMMSGVGCAVLWLASLMGSSLAARLIGLIHIGDTIQFGGFGAERYFIIKAALLQFMENPLLGHGLVVEGYHIYPHNAFVEAFMTTGLIGGSIFAVFAIGCLYRSFQLLRWAPMYGWVSVIYVHYFMYLQFSSSVIINSYFWYAAAGVLGFSQCLYVNGRFDPVGARAMAAPGVIE